jgi:hypothetical protein
VLAIALISILTFVPLSQNDFWLQAAIGRMILQTGEIPHTVLFPFTWVRDNPFNAHEWLPSIAFHLLDKTLGYDGLLFVQGALGLALFALCLGLAYRMTRSTAVALLFACLAMAVANYRHYLRPEIFALLLFVAELHVLTIYRLRGDWRRLLYALPIAIVWANTHGSFLVGPIIAAIFALGEAAESVRRNANRATAQRLRGGVTVGAPYAITALAMLLVSLLNPLGIELLHFALALSGSEVTKTFIREWLPTFSAYFMGRPAFPIFIGSMAVTLAVVVACRRRLTVTDVLLLAAFLVLALTRSRFVVLFGFASLAVCTRLLGAGPWRAGWERAALGISVGVSLVGIALALRFGNAYGAFPFHAQSTDLTEPMIAQLSKPGMQGNVFNSYELGAELIYRTYPRLRPSIDSRIDSYGDRYFLLQEQLQFDEPLLKDFVADFDVRYMLLLWTDFERVKKMESLRENWIMQFADHKAVLLVRRPGFQPRTASTSDSKSASTASGSHGR